jgi:hypothetical protein
MAEVAEDLRPRLDEAGATLEVVELPEVRGDARQLRRLLQNLVANAVKFRGRAPAAVTVSAQAGPEGWVVSVEDNGVGSRAHDAGRIFGDVRSARAATTRAPGSASPSAGASSRRTAVRSGSSPPTAAAACSGSRCRSDGQPIGTLASRPSADSHG